MIILGLIGSVLVTVLGVVMIIVGVREGKKQEEVRFHRQELKYYGFPCVVGGLLCSMMLVCELAGWNMDIVAWLLLGVIGFVCLGALGGTITQLREIARRNGR